VLASIFSVIQRSFNYPLSPELGQRHRGIQKLFDDNDTLRFAKLEQSIE
jgi:hypothetical protein